MQYRMHHSILNLSNKFQQIQYDNEFSNFRIRILLIHLRPKTNQ